MDKFLNELRSQYWYWYVREQLLIIEIGSIDRNIAKLGQKNTAMTKQKISRLEASKKDLLLLRSKPLTGKIYTSPDMQKRLDELDGAKLQKLDFAKPGDKYKNGNKAAPKALVKRIDFLIPGSARAFYEGPSKLFRVVESERVQEAIVLLISEFLIKIAKTENEWSEDGVFTQAIQKLAVVPHMQHLDVIQTWASFEQAIELLFKNRLHGSDFEILSQNRSGNAQIDPTYLDWLTTNKYDELYQEPSYILLQDLAPIILGLSFIRARFLDDSLPFFRVCFHRKYLRILHEKFMMSEELWFFDQKNGKKLPSKSKSLIKQVFQEALFKAGSFYSHLQEEWEVDLNKFRDNTGTEKELD